MTNHWFRNPLAILPLCLLLILTLAVACGTAEVPTSAPQADLLRRRRRPLVRPWRRLRRPQ